MEVFLGVQAPKLLPACTEHYVNFQHSGTELNLRGLFHTRSQIAINEETSHTEYV